MRRIIFLLIFLILFSLVIRKREMFILHKDIIFQVEKRLQKLKDFGNRYSSKESVINDILKILNCDQNFRFSIVNIQELSDSEVLIMLYDKKNAFACLINYSVKLNKTKRKNKFYYTIKNISIAENKIQKRGNFYDPEFQNYSYPW